MSSLPTVPCGSPIEAAEEVITTRRTPARAAARTTASVPPTLTRISQSGVVRAVRVDAGHVVGDRAAGHPGREPVLVEHVAVERLARRGRRPSAPPRGERASARTASPPSTSRAHSAPPMKPLPPVRKTCGHAQAGERSRSRSARLSGVVSAPSEARNRAHPLHHLGAVLRRDRGGSPARTRRPRRAAGSPAPRRIQPRPTGIVACVPDTCTGTIGSPRSAASIAAPARRRPTVPSRERVPSA